MSILKIMKGVTLILFIIQAALTVLWLYLQTLSSHTTAWNYWFNLYGLSYLIGGTFGLLNYQNVGGYSSSIGKAIFFTSIGLILYALGQFIWLVFNVRGIDLPYPSLADLFYVLYVPFVFIGFWYIVKIFSTFIDWKIIVEFILIVAFAFILLLFFVDIPNFSHTATPLTEFLDIYYPLTDAVLLAFGLIILQTSGGKFNKTMILFSAGLLLQTGADIFFSYSVDHNVSWNGNLNDYLFSLSGFIIALAIVSLVKSFTSVSVDHSSL